ncbi:MAG: hypothetical protein BWX55_01764 [Deltaproteobacteria bacterium ADurb.Bin022]|nr:MAG: hypothetical protein BWX55_01764 [Deltaproteobacteria bacterium ADurb.Bin022]
MGLDIGLGFNHHQEDINAADCLSGRPHHGTVQRCFRFMHSGRIEKNQLGIRIIFYPGYFIPRCLRLMGHNGYFITDNGVEKR